MIENFSGTTAVITGGAAGIGLAVAKRLGAAGANLVLADIEAPVLEAATAALNADGVAALGVRTDVTDRSALEALLDAASERFGNVHLLMNNAGVVTTGRVEEQSDAQWDWVLDVNLRAVIDGCRLFLPHMKGHGEPAHIVNTASLAGLGAGPLMAPYHVTKFGVVALSESLQHELRNDGSSVGVSVLCPGFLTTGIGHSDRNARDGVAGWVASESASGAEYAQLLQQGVDDGLSPSVAAERVHAAVTAGDFWILTHPQGTEMTQRRADEVRAAWTEE